MDIDSPTSPFNTAHSGSDDDWEDSPYQPTASTSALPSSDLYQGQVDKEWRTLNEKYTNDGYREGITSGKLSTLQSGFDSGYLLASVPARRLGALRGRASALLALLLLPPPSSSPSASPRPNVSFSTRTTTSRSSSSAIPSTLTSHLSGPQRESLVEETREVVKELGRLRMLEVVGRDLEAEEHARSHGEVEEGKQMEWEEGERKEMDELEGLMEGMTGGDAAGGPKKEEGGVVTDLGLLEERLGELMRRMVGGGGMEM